MDRLRCELRSKSCPAIIEERHLVEFAPYFHALMTRFNIPFVERTWPYALQRPTGVSDCWRHIMYPGNIDLQRIESMETRGGDEAREV